METKATVIGLLLKGPGLATHDYSIMLGKERVRVDEQYLSQITIIKAFAYRHNETSEITWRTNEFQTPVAEGLHLTRVPELDMEKDVSEAPEIEQNVEALNKSVGFKKRDCYPIDVGDDFE